MLSGSVCICDIPSFTSAVSSNFVMRSLNALKISFWILRTVRAFANSGRMHTVSNICVSIEIHSSLTLMYFSSILFRIWVHSAGEKFGNIILVGKRSFNPLFEANSCLILSSYPASITIVSFWLTSVKSRR